MIGVYFSGTGNSKYIIDRLTKGIDNNSKIISIEDENVIDEIKQNDIIYFAYPIQFSNMPYIVRDFININKDIWLNKKIFIVCTMGLFSGDGSRMSKVLFKKYKANILGALHVVMPDIVADSKMIKHTVEENKQIIAKANDKVDIAINEIKNNNYPKNGLSFLNHLGGLFGQRLYFYSEGMGYRKKINIDKDKCIHCMKCVSNCPMKNIDFINNEIVTMGKCTKCYRCVTNCPKQAITILGKKVIQQIKIENFLK